jgi:uncharacterized membrane protein YcaP (DUF421 family)
MDLVLRTAVIFVFIFLLTRLLPRRELSSLEPFDLILVIVIGDLVQQGITQSDNSVVGVLIVVSTLALLTMLLSFLSYRFRRLRPLLDGRPVLLVEKGSPIEENLRRERITVEEIEAAARLQSLESLDKVRFAILETGGQISFVPEET